MFPRISDEMSLDLSSVDQCLKLAVVRITSGGAVASVNVPVTVVAGECCHDVPRAASHDDGSVNRLPQRLKMSCQRLFGDVKSSGKC